MRRSDKETGRVRSLHGRDFARGGRRRDRCRLRWVDASVADRSEAARAAALMVAAELWNNGGEVDHYFAGKELEREGRRRCCRCRCGVSADAWRTHGAEPVQLSGDDLVQTLFRLYTYLDSCADACLTGQSRQGRDTARGIAARRPAPSAVDALQSLSSARTAASGARSTATNASKSPLSAMRYEGVAKSVTLLPRRGRRPRAPTRSSPAAKFANAHARAGSARDERGSAVRKTPKAATESSRLRRF